MPLIVDANVASETFNQKTEDFLPIIQALFSGKAKLVYGGKLLKEYEKISEIIRVIRTLDQAGIATLLEATIVNDEEINVKSTGFCKSNDHHIIALARIGKARLLCSKDQLLHADFTNKNLINPRGKVYQNKTHALLIKELGA